MNNATKMKKQLTRPAIKTDDTYHETIQHGTQQYPFAYYYEDIWNIDFHCVNWHWHNEFEFIYIEKGEATCYIGTNQIKLKKSEGLFVNSCVLHRYESHASTIVPFIIFHPTLLGESSSVIYNKYIKPIADSTIEYQHLSNNIEWQNNILKALATIANIQTTKPSYNAHELQTMQHILNLWANLYNNIENNILPKQDGLKKRQQSKLNIMVQFIHNNYSQPITLNDISNCVAISPNNALNLFRTHLHTSPITYLLRYRLAQAAARLISTEKKLTTIAEECGFASSSYFCRKFKEHYRQTANMYRTTKTQQ